MFYSNRTPAWMNSRAFWIVVRVFGLAMMLGMIYVAVREGLWFAETVTRAAADNGIWGVLGLAGSWARDGVACLLAWPFVFAFRVVEFLVCAAVFFGFFWCLNALLSRCFKHRA